ncbi:MAG TPA: SBBP repeat-containing protein, partial [Blastocatellia bacterium]|nr:SBBP repeat-containing protein [Blastocatellia bacterium]
MTAKADGRAAISPRVVDRGEIARAYGRLPMRFELNQGQANPLVKFLSRGRNYTLFLTANEAVMALSNGARTATVRMKVVGANPLAEPRGLDQLPGESNYFIGNDSKRWRTGVPGFSKVRLGGVYRGIDQVYYGNQQQLEYDFIVAPGADARPITLAFEGAQSVRIDRAGDLVLTTPAGELRHLKPFVYQEIGGRKQQISARYVMKRKGQVGFEIGAYQKSRPLVIDPVLVYSTYLGGNGNDYGNDITVDSQGNSYVTGHTGSLDFPTLPATPDTAQFRGDAFVTKLNPAGTALVFSTYFGGTEFDEGNGIEVDSSGNVYVAGTTSASDLPVTENAYDTTYNSSSDLFVTKFNQTGSVLLYSTYIGGTDSEGAEALALDAQNNAVITGDTTSPDYPVSENALQTEWRGGENDSTQWGDAFVTKLNAAGTGLVFSTFLGGAEGEVGFGVEVDAAGNVYVGGATGSTDFPATPGAFQTAMGGDGCDPETAFLCQDGFVAKINPSGTALVYATYLGGFGPDSVVDIAVDSLGHAYVTGTTITKTFPVKDALQPVFGGFRDAFVTKLNTDGTGLVYSTYLGGRADDRSQGIAIDSEGSAYISGTTNSDNFPTSNPIQPFLTGSDDIFVENSYDAFISKLNPAGSALSYSTYLGGSRVDNRTHSRIAVDSAGSAYVTGSTRSPDFPTTPGAFQPSFGGDPDNRGNADAFVAKIGETPPFDVCLQDNSNGNIL